MAEECGCKPDYTFVGHGEDATEVIYCPMHKAAPEMLAALKAIDKETASLKGLRSVVRVIVHSAIAQAGGEEVEA